MARNNIQLPQQPGMIMGGGDGSYVSAEMLKQVDTPVETLIGAANGALSGAGVAAGISAGLTYFSDRQASLGKDIVSGIKAHKWPIVAATVVLGAIGGLVRFSRARKHNEWSDRHYNFLEQQQASHVQQVTQQQEEKSSDDKGHSR